jgi:TonB-dependent starch-binding outer membrane protein SusC
MMKLYQIIRHVFVVGLMLTSLEAWAQKVTVAGKVTSSDDNTALPGVSIIEKGTTNGTVTDADGNYSISVNGDAILAFSFVGYATQEVSVGGKTTIDIVLASDVTALGEIVVVGYGEIQKKDATGAVVNMSSRDFNKGVLTSPQDLIVGKFAGVSVTSTSGAPGANSTIRIRGGASLYASNDPLIVIDGMPVDNTTIAGISNPLAALNPNDIESYTVLKDASATAIYGSRASNGVIIITTKKGTVGKLQLGYSGNLSFATPIKYVDVLTADEYRETVDLLAAEGIAGLNDTAKEKLGSANTDWQREIFRTAISNDHNVTMSGSVGEIPYRISYGYTDQQGILKTTKLNRNSFNVNVTPTLLNGDLKMTLGAKASYTKTNFGDAAAVGNAVSFDPTQVVRDDADDALTPYGGYFSWLSQGVTNGNSNPVAMLEQTDNQSNAKRLITNALIEYRLPFLKDLKANLNLGWDYTSSEGHNRAPLNAGFVHSTGVLTGRNTTYSAKNHSELLDFYLNYTREIGSHKIDATAGYGWQHFRRSKDNVNVNTIETKVDPPERNENYLISFFGRLNYTFKGRYLLTATLRDDGSSRFSKDTRWGLFPSVALAWQLKEESFLSNVEFLSDLKLRAGYGVTGQQDIQGKYYPYLAVYRGSNAQAQYQLGDTYYITQRPEAYDANIKWEETTTYNIGIDAGILNDKFTGSLEVFQKDTKDLLNFIKIPNGSNFSNFLTTNVGSMEIRGIELTLNARAISRQDLNWNVGFNFTALRSKITKLILTDDPSYLGVAKGGIGVAANIQNDQVGFPATSFFTLQQVYDDLGLPIEGLYVDRSGQGGTVSTNNANFYRNNTPVPKFLIGLNSNVRYKQVDFSFSSRLSIGNYVYNNVQSGNAFYNAIYTLQHFRNINANVFETGFIAPQQYSDYYVQNASFFKMDNVSLGYNFDRVFVDKLKARLSVTVQNAFTITKYKGLDPEIDGGIDNNIYPRPRTVLIGFNLNF